MFWQVFGFRSTGSCFSPGGDHTIFLVLFVLSPTSQRVPISIQTSLLILREEEVFFYPSSMASMDNVIHSIHKTGHAEPEKFYLCIP